MSPMQELMERFAKLEQAVLSTAVETFDYEGAANFLHCSRSFVEGLVSSGKIAYCKGEGRRGAVTFLKSDLVAYLNSQRIASVEENRKRHGN